MRQHSGSSAPLADAQINDTLDVLISDFGVSIWRSDEGEVKKKPFYMGKSIYSKLAGESDEEFSYTYAFDVR